ncbi:MAG: cytochrome c [Gemmataceae bacterium]|nr:cytochrome c [Gemmata sp.]MDW8199388.1 cytochrome c [Gemmataceae bacterium]
MRWVALCCLFSGLVAYLAATAQADNAATAADSYKKAAEADVKFLQTRLAELAQKQAAGENLLQGHIKPALGVALLLAAYGQAMGDNTLRGEALKIIDAIQAKKFADANTLAKNLAVKPGQPGKLDALPKPLPPDAMLEAVMNPYRLTKVGGLNIEKDIRDMIKGNNPLKIEPAAVEVLAVRTAVLSAYASHYPNPEAQKTPADKKQWEKWSLEAMELSQQLAAEATKGSTADTMKMKKLLTEINNTCNHCHEKYRD